MTSQISFDRAIKISKHQKALGRQLNAIKNMVHSDNDDDGSDSDDWSDDCDGW